MRLPLLEIIVAFAGANIVWSRFEKEARVSVAKGVMSGLYDLRGDLASGRQGALMEVPREIRGQIRGAIDSTLRSAGMTRDTVRRNAREWDAIRRNSAVLAAIADL